MRYLLLIITLVSSLMFSAGSFAEWTPVTLSVDGDVAYLDYDRIRKHDGHRSFWLLTDARKPSDSGVMSEQIYSEGDCERFRYRNLTRIFYKQPMGKGKGDSQTSANQEWKYPPPDTVMEKLLNKVCAH